MEGFRKIARRMAAFVVTWQASRIYRKAVACAEQRHSQERTMIYVIEDPLHPRRLAAFDRRQFRRVKEIMGIRDPRHSTLLIREGSFYHTADAGERNALSLRQKEARRLAFIRMNLKRAGLAD